MPILTTQIGAEGPIVKVGISVSTPRAQAIRAAGLSVPPMIVINALIDTGASCTMLDTQVIKTLGLIATGIVPILTPSTGTSPHACNQYDIALSMLMEPVQLHVVALTIPVIETNLSAHGFQGLIGRDVLAKGVFWYNGQKDTLTLAF